MTKHFNKKLIYRLISVFLAFTVSFAGISVMAQEDVTSTDVENVEQTQEPVETVATQDSEEEIDLEEIEEEFEEEFEEEVGMTLDEYMANFDEISSNQRLTLYADTSTGEVVIFDDETSEYWFSNPPERENDTLASGYFRVMLASQLLMVYSDVRGVILERGSSLHSVTRGGLSHEIRGDSIVFFYDFPTDEIMIPVEFSIGDDYFGASILTEEIDQYGVNELVTADLLPYFGAGSLDDEGYLMIPDGSGALINMNNGKTNAIDYIAPVYGIDDKAGPLQVPPSSAWMNTVTLREEIRMPVFGMKKNDVGYIAIITEAAPRAQIKATVSGRGTNYNSIYTQFRYRMSGVVLLTQQEFSESRSSISERETADTPFEIRYYLLDRGDADYVAMANKVRDYQLETTRLEQKVNPGDIPFYLDLYGYINKVKPVLGIPVERVIPLTTLEDVRTISDELFDAGIENIVVNYNNWVKNASFAKIPVRANFQRQIGSRSEFSELEDYLDQKGSSIYLTSDLVNVYETGYGFNRLADATRTVANTPMVMFRQVFESAEVDRRMPSWYLLNPLKYTEFFGKYADNFSKLDTDNVGLDAIGYMLYSDMSNNGIGRSSVPAEVEKSLELVTDQMPSLLLVGGNFYTTPYAEHILDIPYQASFYDIIDESVPFYQIVYHGIINYSTASSNINSNPEHVFLKCLETGASPMYSWVGQNHDELFNSPLNNLYSADYNVWIEFAIEEYKEINSVLSQVSDKFITGHEKLAEGVFATTYDNSLTVIVNYNINDVQVDGETIEGLGYLVREAGGIND